jgi:hypothetical protein
MPAEFTDHSFRGVRFQVARLDQSPGARAVLDELHHLHRIMVECDAVPAERPRFVKADQGPADWVQVLPEAKASA